MSLRLDLSRYDLKISGNLDSSRKKSQHPRIDSADFFLLLLEHLQDHSAAPLEFVACICR